MYYYDYSGLLSSYASETNNRIKMYIEADIRRKKDKKERIEAIVCGVIFLLFLYGMIFLGCISILITLNRFLLCGSMTTMEMLTLAIPISSLIDMIIIKKIL